MTKNLENKIEKMQESINKSTLQEVYTNHYTKLRRADTKRKKEFNLETREKETSNPISLEKIMKNQRNTTQMKEQMRNTEVQINEEEIGKLPEK